MFVFNFLVVDNISIVDVGLYGGFVIIGYFYVVEVVKF